MHFDTFDKVNIIDQGYQKTVSALMLFFRGFCKVRKVVTRTVYRKSSTESKQSQSPSDFAPIKNCNVVQNCNVVTHYEKEK